MALTDQLFDELKDDEGLVAAEAISEEWLMSVRQRIIEGELPTFITPDFKEGWLKYARWEVGHLFTRYEKRVGRTKVRGFFNVLSEKDVVWGSREDNLRASGEYAEFRLHHDLKIKTLRQGSSYVAAGMGTWNDVKRIGHKAVTEAVVEGSEQVSDGRRELVARVDDLYEDGLPYEEWAAQLEGLENAV